jgi:hypothetical protein
MRPVIDGRSVPGPRAGLSLTGAGPPAGTMTAGQDEAALSLQVTKLRTVTTRRRAGLRVDRPGRPQPEARRVRPRVPGGRTTVTVTMTGPGRPALTIA